MRFTSRSSSTSVLVLMGSALVFGGCTKTSDNNSASSKNAPTAVVESTPQKVSTAESPSRAPSAPSALAIATSDGEKSGTRVEITELKRSSDNTVTLKFVMVDDSDKAIGFGYDYGDRDNEIKDHSSIGGVNLVDSTGKKKYFVVRDSESNCVCSRDVKDIPPGSRANLWAKFPAPPEDVQKISVVIPHFAPLDDVPISH